ncbi:entericidin A/B family lipoprotein [Burkholderia sp. WAC0059]|nr:entericidin A/B family lipoprotein [Burkholderia sp. WAC0059]
MKKSAFLRHVALLLLAGTFLSLAGCNTVAGFGQDISDSSRAVQHAL